MRVWTSRHVLIFFLIGLVLGFAMAAVIWAPPPWKW